MRGGAKHCPRISGNFLSRGGILGAMTTTPDSQRDADPIKRYWLLDSDLGPWLLMAAAIAVGTCIGLWA